MTAPVLLPSLPLLTLAARLTHHALNAAALVGLGLLALAVLAACIVAAAVIDLKATLARPKGG